MHSQSQAAATSEKLDARSDLAASLCGGSSSDRHGRTVPWTSDNRWAQRRLRRSCWRLDDDACSVPAVTDYAPAYYDPMDTEHVTAAICQELERQPFVPIDSLGGRFDGSGLYAIYYYGQTVPLYQLLSGTKIPIYVGQALSHNSATGAAVRDLRPLWGRVRDHHISISTSNLPVGEFGLRLLCLPDVPADLGENGLRVFYRPVWNAILKGFGSHEQGPSTRQGARSKWDTVHPGRNRTFGSEPHNRDRLVAAVREHVAAQLAGYDAAPWRKTCRETKSSPPSLLLHLLGEGPAGSRRLARIRCGHRQWPATIGQR
jgi:hypothetical protein